MTKTLTENKWFYTENGIKDASWNIVFKSEVVATVPSYDEYRELVSKTEQLEKQLAIATTALKNCHRDMYYWARMTLRDCRIFCLIEKALKEIKEVK